MVERHQPTTLSASTGSREGFVSLAILAITCFLLSRSISENLPSSSTDTTGTATTEDPSRKKSSAYKKSMAVISLVDEVSDAMGSILELPTEWIKRQGNACVRWRPALKSRLVV